MRLLSAILILWLPFSLAALFAPFRLLYGMLVDDITIWKPVGRAMDKLMAALLGFGGNYTLSAELAVSSRLQWLRKVLDMVEYDHCNKAAKSEGLL